MKTYALMLFLHLLAIVVWVGGMFLMHFAVRPAAVQLLDPPRRLPLLAEILRRFLDWVAVAVVVALLSGIAIIVGAGGFAVVPPSVHLMFGGGLVMIVVFVHIRFGPFPRLRTAVAAQDWPAGAKCLERIRKEVAFNLALGIAVIADATLGRMLP